MEAAEQQAANVPVRYTAGDTDRGHCNGYGALRRIPDPSTEWTAFDTDVNRGEAAALRKRLPSWTSVLAEQGLSSPQVVYRRRRLLLGDGALTYSREDIVETHYTAHLWRGLSASGGLQFIDHPGYNRDRGPVLVEMLRLHIDF